MQVNTQRLVERFCRLVAVDSPSLGEEEMAALLTRELQALGFAVSKDNAGQALGGACGNIYAYLPGSMPGEPLLFSAHMDTVTPALGKRAVVHGDGRITSAGDTVLGADDCAGIAAILEAVTTLREGNLPHRGIEILFTVAEEIYCRGAEVADYARLQAREAYVLDLTGPVGRAAYAAPTVIEFEAEVTGRAAHAGLAPQCGCNAIAVAARAVAALPQGQVTPGVTVNIGQISGGQARNIVSASCTARGEIRALRPQDAEHWLERVEEAFAQAAQSAGAQSSLTHRIVVHGYETPADHPVVARFASACRALSVPCELVATFGGSDNNHFARHGIIGLVLATAMNDCHSTREYTTVQELTRITALTAHIMTT